MARLKISKSRCILSLLRVCRPNGDFSVSTELGPVEDEPLLVSCMILISLGAARSLIRPACLPSWRWQDLTCVGSPLIASEWQATDSPWLSPRCCGAHRTSALSRLSRKKSLKPTFLKNYVLVCASFIIFVISMKWVFYFYFYLVISHVKQCYGWSFWSFMTHCSLCPCSL